MSSAARDVVELLEQDDIGLFGGPGDFSLSVGMERAFPLNQITVYDTGGDGSDTDELDIEYPMVQVRIRARDYLAGMDKARQIKKCLQKKGARDVGARSYLSFQVMSDTAKIGETDGNAHVIVTNYRAIVQNQEA